MECLQTVFRILRTPQRPPTSRPKCFRFRLSAKKDGRLQGRKGRRGKEKKTSSLSQVNINF